MIVTRRATFRLYPTASQERQLGKWRSMHQQLYNAALYHRKTEYQRFGRSVSYLDQQNCLPEFKKEWPEYIELGSQALQATLKERLMKKLSVKPKNWLLSVHVASGGMWLGTAFCLVAIAIIKRDTPNGDELYAINSVLKFMDDWVIIPTAMLSLLTGGLLSWLTIWGFTKHYWVIVKWVATVTLITTGTIWLGPWLNAMTAISEAERLQALHNPLYVLERQGVIVGGSIQTACLLALIAISVLKPWGRRLIKEAKEIKEVVSSKG